MSIEQAIHEHWTTWRPLVDLVAAGRVYTGLAPPRGSDGTPGDLPFVSLATQGDSQVTRTSSRTILTSRSLRFSVFAARYDDAKRIAAAIQDHFNRAGFAWSRGRVLDMKQTNKTEVEEEDGAWHIALVFLARVSQEA